MGLSVAGKVAKQYVEKFPELSSRTIARKLRKDEPKLFRSIENARTHVRIHRGNSGKKLRNSVADKSNFQENGKAGHPFALRIPRGKKRRIPEVKIPLGSKVLILADMHIPYHDENAIELAVNFGLQEGCDTLYLNGDSCDFYSISRWQKDPRKRNLKKEVRTTEELLRMIGEPFPTRYFKFGNHDDRWEHYLASHAEDLLDFDEFDLRNILQLEKHGYQVVESKQRALLGPLNLIHGHEFARGFSSPVNPARGLWLKMQSTAACSHFHRSSLHTDTQPLKGKTHATWSTGCLCDLNPEYDSLNKWNHGFAIVEIESRSKFHFDNYLISGGEVWSN